MSRQLRVVRAREGRLAQPIQAAAAAAARRATVVTVSVQLPAAVVVEAVPVEAVPQVTIQLPHVAAAVGVDSAGALDQPVDTLSQADKEDQLGEV